MTEFLPFWGENHYQVVWNFIHPWYQEYLAAGHPLEKVLEDCKAVMVYFVGVVEETTDLDKKNMQATTNNKKKCSMSIVIF